MNMKKTVLIGGKDSPDGNDFAAGMVLKDRNVFITAKGEVASLAGGVTAVTWNKSSSISARSVILSCLNSASTIDEAILFFDEVFFAPKYAAPDEKSGAQIVFPTGATQINRAFDEMILSYQFLASEIISRLSKKRSSSSSSASPAQALQQGQAQNAKLIFILKSNTSESQAAANPGLRKSFVLSNSLVASCAAAFRAFAENVAAALVESEYFLPVLVECDSANETAAKDSTLSSWLCDYIKAIDSLKKPLSAKQKVSWVKAGAKSPGGFSFFR